MSLLNFFQSFLNNDLFNKSVKFDFRKKSYNYPYLDTFEDYRKTFGLDETVTEEDVLGTESYKSYMDKESNPEVYFINLKFFNFDNLVSTLINDFKLFLLINNIEKVNP